MFFLTPNRNMFAGKLVIKSERFLAVLREHIIFNELRFIKWVRFFERNYIVKWVIFFGSFCWLWHFLLNNLKLKRNSDDVHWNVFKNIKKLYARKNIFKKIILNMRFWIIYILVQILFFGGLLGTVLGCFSQCFFFSIFRHQPATAADIFTQAPPFVKKLPTALNKTVLSFNFD